MPLHPPAPPAAGHRSTRPGGAGGPAGRHLRLLLACLLVLGVAAGCSDGGDEGGEDTGPTTVPGSRPEDVEVAPRVEPVGEVRSGSLRTADGRERTYQLYVSASLEPQRPAPLLVALHGGGGSGQQFARGSGLTGLAEANRFLVVFPDGAGAGRGADQRRTWNAGGCCGVAAREDVDDVAFVAALLDRLESEQAVDGDRVFAAGHSNGGMLAYRLACELGDRFAAVAVQSSTLQLDRCEPSQPVSILHVHGTADVNVPIEGGRGEGPSGTDFAPPRDGIATFVAADGCPATAETASDPANGDVRIERWAPCDAGTEVRFVQVDGAAHAWMGSPVRSRRRGPEVYADYDTSAEMWAFLAAHPRR